MSKFVTTDEQHERARRKHAQSQKFHTTAKQHKVRKAYYGLRSGWQHKKSAIDPQWWADRQAQDPYLYHKTDPKNVQNILKDGLFPFDSQENPVGTTYDDTGGMSELRPRSGHVYLADKHTIDNLNFAGTEDAKNLRIDTRHLDPQKLNADEDSFVFNSPPNEPDGLWGQPPRDQSPMWNRTLRRVVPDYVHRQYVHDYDQHGNADQTTEFRNRFEQTHAKTDPHWANYGEWANDRLNHPLHTQWSIAGNGTVAYNGHIPPEAIEYQNAQGKWNRLTGEHQPCDWCGSGSVDPESNQCLACGEKPWDSMVQDLTNEESRVAAIDPQWLNQWIEKNGPYLYHGTPTRSVQDSIMQHGLYPHDEEIPGENDFNLPPRRDEFGDMFDQSRSQWGSNYLEPRAGHVYMGTARKASSYVEPGGGMVGIDLRKLDPDRIHADEDAFNYTHQHHPIVKQFYDPEHEAFDPPIGGMNWHNGMENLGQWADRVGLGNHDPKETHHSLEHNGSVAYDGVVPPEAIVDGSQQWTSEPDIPKALPWEKAASEEVEQPAADPMHVGLPIPRNAGSHILRWAKDQQWPEGTQLESPNDYHVTLLFTPTGHDQHSEAWWVQHLDKARAKIAGFTVFPAAHKDGYAYVLRVESPEIDEHANKLMDSAEWVGLEPSRFPGGYKAHITVGYGPVESLNVQAPTFEFDVGPSKVSPKKARQAPEPPDYRQAFGADRCGNCKMFDKGHCWGYGNKKVDEDDVCDSWSPESKKSAYEPGMVEALDHLSLSSVAHNLHIKFEQGGMDPQGAVEYAKKLLTLIGYPDDKMTLQAAIQAWQQLYPMDKMLAEPEAQPELATVPQESYGYGTTSASTMQWRPGGWGKGLIIDNQLHTWPTVGSHGGSMGDPHHATYLRANTGLEMRDGVSDRWSDPVIIGPGGHYTTNNDYQMGTMGACIRTPERFAQAGGGLKYVADQDKWARRVAKTAMYPMGMQDYYHVSPRKNRESILENGLTGHETQAEHSPWNYDTWEQPQGNYVFNNHEDARNYAFNLYNRTGNPSMGDPEDQWEYPEPPNEFNDWDWEKQDDWHAQNEPTPRMDDPNGYDIWRVQGHGLPIASDPESALTQQMHPESYNDMKGVRNWDLGQLHDQEDLTNWGSEPIRQYVPQHVPPHRLTLHEHMPTWEMTPEAHEESNEDAWEREYPSPYNWTPYTALPFPTHEGRVSSYFHVAPTTERARIQQHGLQPSDPRHNWPSFDNAPAEDLPPTGVYMFNDRDRADKYRTTLEFRRGVPHDMWSVVLPRQPKQDPDLGSSSQYLDVPVNPDLLRLEEGPEHREYMPEYMQQQYVQPTDPWQRGDYPLGTDEGRGRPYPQNDAEAWKRMVGARSAAEKILQDAQANYVIQKDNDEDDTNEGSTEPQEVMNPHDHWPEFGEQNPGEKHYVPDTEHDYR